MRLKSKERKIAYNAVHNLLKPTYFRDGVPLNELCECLRENGLVILQEDNTEWAGMLCGSCDHSVFVLAKIETAREENGITFYIPLDNGLVISWYWMEGSKGKTCEVCGYIS